MALDEEPRQRHPIGQSRHRDELARLLALSDGVFAIAITLLVLQLTVPEIAGGAVGSRLSAQLAATIPRIVTYCIGFAVIALFWIGHRRSFLYIVRTNGVLTLLNLAVLLCIAFMPFPIAILGLYGNTAVAVIFYTSTVALAGFGMLLLWVYAGVGHRLISRDVSSRLVTHQALRAAISPLVFLLSMPVGLVEPDGCGALVDSDPGAHPGLGAPVPKGAVASRRAAD
ncbi:MAG: DUF1211 domain-containing protein [Candidatus Nephthysia bennettiae]|uniref:DUF1211 domain-containing protein n=1 Tax=Candidatus Nephthysia bennettiae TaxID=3127016 RepID=A0A934K259_9BACT|nr:DUF1211 domain-containing protein [Candidatus Dormibacteraeota bacterium]MBJ7614453.1 DUF1211 domain-containing protein [Candidatus Dormibacteraeota bacterium]PZR98172.1 MAG: DUF1211 domain-containing protein [Candidatus Dormibacteraeota bacterium]